jgi:hypothetical protein
MGQAQDDVAVWFQPSNLTRIASRAPPDKFSVSF